MQLEAVVDGIGLAQHAVRHVVAVVDAISLLEHVLGLGSFGVVGSVLIDIGPHIGQEVGPVAGLLEGRAQAIQISLVGGKLLAEEGEVVLFESGCSEGSFGFKEAGKLVDDSFALSIVRMIGREQPIMRAVPFLKAPVVSFRYCALLLLALEECSALSRIANRYGTGSQSAEVVS